MADSQLFYTTVTRVLNLTGLQWWYPNRTRYVNKELFNNSIAYRKQLEPGAVENGLDLYGTGPKG